MKTHFTTVACAAAALACACFSACAAVSPIRTWGLDAAAAQRVDEGCRATMGIVPGNGWYNACADSLSRTLKTHAVALDLVSAHQACERTGQPAQTAEFDRCVVEQQDANQMAAERPPATIPASRLTTAQPLFRSITRSARLHRERLTCAGLGLDPVTPEFSACVVSLNQAFFTLDNPR